MISLSKPSQAWRLSHHQDPAVQKHLQSYKEEFSTWQKNQTDVVDKSLPERQSKSFLMHSI